MDIVAERELKEPQFFHKNGHISAATQNPYKEIKWIKKNNLLSIQGSKIDETGISLLPPKIPTRK
jgi:hypothetical protein